MTHRFSQNCVQTRNSLANTRLALVPFLAVVILSVALVSLAQTPAIARGPGQPVSERANSAAGQKPLQFAKVVDYPSGGLTVSSVAVADLNGDGHLDLVVGNACTSRWGCDPYEPDLGAVGVLLGKGDGTFQATVSYSSGGYVSSAIAVGDLNGDGHPDLVIANECQNVYCTIGGISVLLGNGDGTFQPAVNYDWNENAPASIAIADVNGDGYPDVIVGDGCPTDICTGGAVGIFLGNGDGTFQPAITYSTGGSYAAMAIGDLNGDGKPDLAMAIDTNTVAVMLGNGDGTFQSPVDYGSGGSAADWVTIGDVNGDGKPDLLVANGGGTVGVLLGNGDGTFQPAMSYSAGSALAIAIGDLNGDGHPDLAVADLGLVVLLGNGDGTFQNPIGFKTGGIGGDCVAVADLNKDGRPDIVVGNWGSDSVGVLLNNLSAKTTTVVTSSLNPSQVGESVTFTATITSISSIPDGSTVTFYEGKNEIGTATTTNGVASMTTSFSEPKTYVIVAKYAGDAFHKASLGKVKQVVNQ